MQRLVPLTQGAGDEVRSRQSNNVSQKVINKQGGGNTRWVEKSTFRPISKE